MGLSTQITDSGIILVNNRVLPLSFKNLQKNYFAIILLRIDFLYQILLAAFVEKIRRSSKQKNNDRGQNKRNWKQIQLNFTFIAN